MLQPHRFGGSGGVFPQEVVYNSGTGATETVPTAATQVVIRGWGAGGSGATGGSNRRGGGGGAYFQITKACAAGDMITFTVGEAGEATIGEGNGADGGDTTATGTLTGGGAINLSAGGGGGGGLGTVGAAGTASGGDINTTGGIGGLNQGGSSPNGGAGGLGSLFADGVWTQPTAGSAPGGGGGAGNSAVFHNGRAGAAGRLSFTYT